MECPQETLPWSRPHSSFNTGRKIKKKIAKSLERGGKQGASELLTSSLPGQASIRLSGPRPQQPEEQDVPKWGSLEETDSQGAA